MTSIVSNGDRALSTGSEFQCSLFIAVAIWISVVSRQYWGWWGGKLHPEKVDNGLRVIGIHNFIIWLMNEKQNDLNYVKNTFSNFF